MFTYYRKVPQELPAVTAIACRRLPQDLPPVNEAIAIFCLDYWQNNTKQTNKKRFWKINLINANILWISVMSPNLNRRFLLKCQLFLLIGYMRTRRRNISKQKKRKCWRRSIFLEREKLGQYHTLFKELQLGDREYFFRYLRMSPERLEHLLSMVGPLIKKKRR